MFAGRVVFKNSPRRFKSSTRRRSMTSSTPSFDGDTRQALGSLLRSRGFDLSDFDIVEDLDSDLVHLLGLVGGIVTVRRLSTGEERLYTTGPGSAWFAALLMDLEQGHFGRAPVSAPMSLQ
jgi:hypothetical protein